LFFINTALRLTLQAQLAILWNLSEVLFGDMQKVLQSHLCGIILKQVK